MPLKFDPWAVHTPGTIEHKLARKRFYLGVREVCPEARLIEARQESIRMRVNWPASHWIRT